jgi:predicted RNA-binding Zn-ribbon protein involved in translation (DUF1610 family)
MTICDKCHKHEADYECRKCHSEVCDDCGDDFDYMYDGEDGIRDYEFKCPMCGCEKYNYVF